MSSGSSHNQTLSFLMRRFGQAGIRPVGKLGQNFLIDLNLVRLLVRRAALGPDDVVLEVGTGTGSLTALMAREAAAVVTVEIDRNLHQLASEELADLANVTMLQMDALAGKHQINPEVLRAIHERLDAGSGRVFKLAANLPYVIATPLLTNLLALDRPPRSMTVTIQKELADRMVARPSTKPYGSLSIWLQSQCRVEIVRVMPPSVFFPAPKVSSAIVHVELDDALRARIPDRQFFHRFVRSVFLLRRKFLRANLFSAIPELEKAQVDEIMAELALGPKSRAEQLDVDTMLALSECVRAVLAR